MDNYDLQVDIARSIFLDYDQTAMIRKFCLKADEAWLCLTYLNTPCRICRKTGTVEEFRENRWAECRNFATVMTLYDLLCYHKGDTLPALSGQWCTVGTFIVTGITETDTSYYAKLFDGQPEKLKTACNLLGGTMETPLAGADVTCRIPVTPFFPVLLQFWHGDEEFPPKLLILWDRSANQYLRFETTFYLQGDLLRRLKEMAK